MKACFYCGIEMTPHVKQKRGVQPPVTMETTDHIVPHYHGGSRRKENTVKACLGCNRDKFHLTLDEYRVVVAFRNGLVAKPDVLFNAERLETLWPPESE